MHNAELMETIRVRVMPFLNKMYYFLFTFKLEKVIIAIRLNIRNISCMEVENGGYNGFLRKLL